MVLSQTGVIGGDKLHDFASLIMTASLEDEAMEIAQLLSCQIFWAFLKKSCFLINLMRF
jgi:hypothetical protein